MTNLDIETFWAVVQHGTMTAAAGGAVHHPAHAVHADTGAGGTGWHAAVRAEQGASGTSR